MAADSHVIGVVGLGYVGLPVAVAFASKWRVIGFDTNESRVAELAEGRDRTGEIVPEMLAVPNLEFTNEPSKLRKCDFVIVAVPTPVDRANRPDLSALKAACGIVGSNLARGATVVFESTVYPGVTEDLCRPILEERSRLRCGVDFRIGYSPERINPGDREHTFRKILKVVAGGDDEATALMAEVYGAVVEAGVHRAPSIRVAEAAKVIENTQRDLNIALMNELALIFHRLGIDTNDVLEAARTKWNFLPFFPGLVGGHCIGVDPYFLTHKAEEVGYRPQVILSGRRINDGMGEFVADQLVLHLVRSGVDPGTSRVTILGATFKENVADLRNSGVGRIVGRLREYGIIPQVHDPVAVADEAPRHLGMELVPLDGLAPAAAVVLAVGHRQFVEGGWPLLSGLLHGGEGFVMDIRGVLPRPAPGGVTLWRL